ncbi:MAG: sigma-70 family RNA polymerase sigma factor [Bacteroidota bacterium]
MPHTSSSGLDAIAARIGFALDDYEAANSAFGRWQDSREDTDLETIQMWAYGYVQRYFLSRFANERSGGASDIDAAVTRAFTRILDALHRITGAFASYVSVVCKNVLLNHRRDRKQTTEVMEDTATERQLEAEAYDRQLVQRVVASAFDGLPPAIGTVGRMRYLELKAYDEIAEATGHPIATVRTYAAKVRTRLADHPDLRELHFSDVLPPGVTLSP